MKVDIYRELISSTRGLTESEDNLIANLANITALLKERLGYFWIGFYIVDLKTNQLVLGPFQGPLACTRIAFGKGVCGKCWESSESLIVPNVHEFTGHIACSPFSKSEIVVPIIKKGQVVAVLDIDSDKFDDFNEEDKVGLERITEILADLKWLKTDLIS